MAAAGNWAEAARVLVRADDSLRDLEDARRFSFACDLGNALLRTGDEAGHVAFANGLASMAPERVAACHCMYAEALLSAGDLERAAFQYLHALAAGAPQTTRTRYERLDPGVRARAERALADLRTQPLFSFVTPAGTPEQLAGAMARWTTLANPTRHAYCGVEESVAGTGRDRGLITCWYSDAPMQAPGGYSPHPLESFVWERQGGSVRAVASFAAGTGYDCEEGHEVEPRSLAVLTRRRHGVDGWLFRTVDNFPVFYDAVGQARRNNRTLVWVCLRDTGGCVRVEESLSFCELRADLSPSRCSQDYEGRVRVAGGYLRVRRRHGVLPPPLSAPVALAQVSAPLPVAPSTSAAPARGSRGCRFLVADPRPPLNVRAEPYGRAAVLGTLSDGAVVELERSQGRWLRLRAPIAGWVWSAAVRRECPPSPTRNPAPQ